MNAGAVPFIRTNLAHTMMSLGGHNPIYGQTKNPLQLTRSPGGSSCGEGAAVGSGSSLLGLGSDIGKKLCVLSDIKPCRMNAIHWVILTAWFNCTI